MSGFILAIIVFTECLISLLQCTYRSYIEVQYVLLVVWLIYQDWFLRIYCISEPFLVCHDIALIHYDGS